MDLYSELLNEYPKEFIYLIKDLLINEKVQKLNGFCQHCATTRLKHCLNVAYLSWKMAKKFNGDQRSAARAGVLHDLFWYDWRTKKTPQLHAFYHPRLALRNAEKLTTLNDIERDAIKKHMWPLFWGMPRYRESYFITMADKYCALAEFFSQFSFKKKQNAMQNS